VAVVSAAAILAVGILGGSAAAVIVFALVALAIGPATAERISRERAMAERSVDSDHRAARRAMNEASGRSWRNLAE
jgi:hypothetical protein